MEFAKVTAIIRNGMIENVERALEKAGVSGFTVAKVKGVGEWEREFSLFNGPSTHFEIEVFTEGAGRWSRLILRVLPDTNTDSARVTGKPDVIPADPIRGILLPVGRQSGS